MADISYQFIFKNILLQLSFDDTRENFKIHYQFVFSRN